MKVKRRYTVGLDKLDDARSQVTVMQKQLTDLQPQLVEASRRVDEIMSAIEKESAEVAKVEKVRFKFCKTFSACWAVLEYFLRTTEFLHFFRKCKTSLL